MKTQITYDYDDIRKHFAKVHNVPLEQVELYVRVQTCGYQEREERHTVDITVTKNDDC